MVQLSVLGGNSTKSSIVEILSEKWPLTARKIYFELTKNYSLSITYQAIHKTLKELTESKILEKTKEGYLLNKEWIKGLGDFSEKLTSRLENLGQKRETKTIQKLVFEKHLDYINFSINLMEDIIQKEGSLDIVYHFRHVPIPHLILNENFSKIKKLLQKIRWTIISKNNTPVNEWLAKQWRDLGVNVIIGGDISSDSTIFLNDYIITLYIPKGALNRWDKKMEDLKNFKFSPSPDAYRKHKTVITIMKDKEIAEFRKKYG